MNVTLKEAKNDKNQTISRNHAAQYARLCFHGMCSPGRTVAAISRARTGASACPSTHAFTRTISDAHTLTSARTGPSANPNANDKTCNGHH